MASRMLSAICLLCTLVMHNADKPTIPLPPTIQPNNPTVGDEVKITCNSEGVPAPTYQFRRDDNLLPANQIDKVNGILTLPDISIEDEAKYTCIASNREGSAESSATLDVKIPPFIEVILDMTDNIDGNNVSVIDVVDGDSVSIICIAEGDPAPTVTWAAIGYDDDYIRELTNDNYWGPQIIVGDGDEREEAAIKRVVRIMEFDSVDHRRDAVRYACIAHNVVGNDKKKIEINVKYPPYIDRYDIADTDIYGWKGHNPKLTCAFMANERANITWYIPDNEFPTDVSKGTIITNAPPYSLPAAELYWHYSVQSLIIDLGDGKDKSLYREYWCDASNSVGRSWNWFTLREAFPPPPPDVHVVSTLSTMVTLKVLDAADNQGLRTSHFLYVLIPADDPSDTIQGRIGNRWNGATLELRNLTSATSYTFSVQGVNGVGPGSNQTIIFKTKN